MTLKQRICILLLSSGPPLTNTQVKEWEKKLAKLPQGFGPGHPDWHVPSLRQKYMIAMGLRFPTPKPPIIPKSER